MTFYHGTTDEFYREMLKEGILFGRRYIVDCDGNIIKEVSRCTYLTPYIEEAKQYGNVILKVEYNPFNSRGYVKRKKNRPCNNYVPDCWQIRVYEPIPLSDVQLIEK